MSSGVRERRIEVTVKLMLFVLYREVLATYIENDIYVSLAQSSETHSKSDVSGSFSSAAAAGIDSTVVVPICPVHTAV